MKIQIHSPSHYITDLRYPWSKHLTQWPPELFVEVACGIHRNVVRFISNKGRVYALKELMTPIARNEYNLLREMEEMGLPVVEPVGLVTNRHEGVSQTKLRFDLVGDTIDMTGRALLVTHYLEGALPYRIIIQQGIAVSQLGQMLDALVELLARLHLSGIYWGDCSLSNALFRRDAGLMAAYLVDAETSEIYPTLSDGQRAYDLELAELNLAGDLMDLEAARQLPAGSDPVELANSVVDRYNKLWRELTYDEIFETEDQFKIEQRVRRLNDLGFDVEEMEITTVDDGERVRMVPRVFEHWHHRRRLSSLTGLQAQENQARRLLNDLSRYKAFLTKHEGHDLPEAVAAYRWLADVYNPSLENIPGDLKGSLDDAEVFHEILEHRWYLSQASGRDVGQKAATEDYIVAVLQRRKAGNFVAGDDSFVKTNQR